MRLLQVDGNSEFSLTDDLINNIPLYIQFRQGPKLIVYN
jgi:hypothetical protein